jgi:hypothetical protein
LQFFDERLAVDGIGAFPIARGSFTIHLGVKRIGILPHIWRARR